MRKVWHNRISPVALARRLHMAAMMTNPITYWHDWWAGNSAVEKAVAVVLLAAAIAVLCITLAWAASAPEIGVRIFVPIDVVALVQAVFAGVAAVGSVAATVYSIKSSNRSKRAETAAMAAVVGSAANHETISKVKDTVDLVERNTNSMTTRLEAMAKLSGEKVGEVRGTAAGEAKALTLAEGQKQGEERERASVAAAGTAQPPVATPSKILDHRGDPIPVADDRTASAN